MKKSLIYITLTFLIVVVFFTSCEKESVIPLEAISPIEIIEDAKINNIHSKVSLEELLKSKDFDSITNKEEILSLIEEQIKKPGFKPECDYCDCLRIYSSYLSAVVSCKINPSVCDLVNQLWLEFDNCKSIPPVCPEGFKFDGCNCYSGVFVPEGYNPFIWGADETDIKQFYVKQNCRISEENNCCPPGYKFDGANCLKTGINIPPDYPGGFIYNGTYYAVPNCGR